MIIQRRRPQIEAKLITRETLANKEILLPGHFEAVLDFIISDSKTGEILKVLPPRKAHSFTKQFMQILYMYFGFIHARMPPLVKATDGIEYPLWPTGDVMNSNAAINIDTYGIIVGTGSTAPTITDYALGTKIAHGTGTGQIQYGAVTFGAPASTATTSQHTVTRNFANASGGTITVNEIGLYISQYTHVLYDSQGQWPFQVRIMILRDVIGGGIGVPNGQTLTVNYRPSVVV